MTLLEILGSLCWIFDPGFGNNRLGTPAVLELRAYDTPFILRDGQLVGQLNTIKSMK